MTRTRNVRKGVAALAPAVTLGRGRYDARLLAAIDWAMQLNEEERPQSVEEWRAALPPLEAEAPPTPRPTTSVGPAPDTAVQAPVPTPGRVTVSVPRWVTVVGLVGLVVVLIGGAYWLGQRGSVVPPEQAAVTPPADPDQGQATKPTPPVSPPTSAPSKPAAPVPSEYPFVVETAPVGAEVEVLGIEEVYRAGVALPVGRYQLEVRAEGYEPQRVWVEHTASGGPHRVELAAVRQPFTIVAAPAGARIRILNIPERYVAGLALPAGEYAVEVSAAGYKTVTETVVHGTTPTERRVALVAAAQPFTIVAVPAEARIRVLNIPERYVAGLALPAGEYAVEVSADGYKTITETVIHGAEPTERRVALARTGPQPGETFRDCPTCPQMVVVPAGSYMMGSPAHDEYRDDDEGPRHRVQIPRPFAVGRYEVTRGEYAAFIRATSRPMGDTCRIHGRKWHEADWHFQASAGRSWDSPGYAQADNHPVVCVSWDDARAYVAWLSEKTGKSYRLLSEAEWEYAVRAGTDTLRYWGDATSLACGYANVGQGDRTYQKEVVGDWSPPDCDDGHGYTSPVGSFSPNGFGLFDMMGNVWEWVEDSYHYDYTGAPADGTAWTRCEYDDNWALQPCRGSRMRRGGSWADDDYHSFFLAQHKALRSANRASTHRGTRMSNLGLRVARTID